MKILPTLSLSLITALLSAACASTAPKAETAAKPNVIVIMADDLGYSDLGSFGGEIRTPRLDQLAEKGVRFTRFTNTGRCCPSRAALISGRYQHGVEMGWMTAADEHRPGYRGQISDQVPTFAEVFKANGYDTYMVGKWHVSVDGSFMDPETRAPNGSWPTERGFDKYYGGLSGGGGYYHPKSLTRGTEHITDLPEDYYYTTAITENAVDYLKGHDPEDPFFLYLAHYAPHRPMQAPEERIATYRELYSVGYDVLREQRYKRLKAMGIFETDRPLPLHPQDFDGDNPLPMLRYEFEGGRPAWEDLSAERQAEWIEEMSTYAAMVEIMDEGIGEVVDLLKARGMYDNTLILFFSDNGATAEGGEISHLAAALSNTPYRAYKQHTHGGGVNSPLIVHYPKVLADQNGAINDTYSHIIDIMPTIMDFAGIEYPDTFAGQPIDGMDGLSLKPVLDGQALADRALFFEHQTASAIIQDDWKLVRLSSQDPWELYNLNDDPFEQDDLFEAKPLKAGQLIQEWINWGLANNVFPLEERPWRERIRYYKGLYPDQDGVDEK